jgi:hypothetical protein
MTKTFACLALGLLLPISAVAASPFDGTWKTDPKTIASSQPDVNMILKDGIFACILCANPRALPADGQVHAISGVPYIDHGSVTIIDDRTVKFVEWRDGKQVLDLTTSCDSSGSTLTQTGYFTIGSNQPVHYSWSGKRVGGMIPGAHAVSGTWQTQSISGSADALTMTLSTVGDSLTMKSPASGSYTAKFDGTEAPFTGDPGITSVSVKRLGNTSYEETDKRNGTIIEVDTITVSPDGKSLQVLSDDRLRGLKGSFTMRKQ